MSELQEDTLILLGMFVGAFIIGMAILLSIMFFPMVVICVALFFCALILIYKLIYVLWRAVYVWRIMGVLDCGEFYVYKWYSKDICAGKFEELHKSIAFTSVSKILDKIEKAKRPNWLIFK